jgi:signal recognition particle subunit SRP54
MTLNDFLEQMQQIKKMGPLKNVLGMLPGVGSKLKDVEVNEDALKKPEAIIQSMTVKERNNPSVLNASRRKRIAAGAGVTVQDVNQLMRQFDQMQTMMKQFTGKGKRFGRRKLPFNF